MSIITTPEPLSLSFISMDASFFNSFADCCSKLDVLFWGFVGVNFVGMFLIAVMQLLNTTSEDIGAARLQGSARRFLIGELGLVSFVLYWSQCLAQPSLLANLAMSDFVSVQLAFCGVGVNLRPLLSRVISELESGRDERLNILGQSGWSGFASDVVTGLGEFSPLSLLLEVSVLPRSMRKSVKLQSEECSIECSRLRRVYRGSSGASEVILVK